MQDKTEKLTVPVKLMYGETELMEIMRAAGELDLPVATFIRRGMRSFMKAYRKQRLQELNIEVSAFGLLSGTEGD